MESLNGFRSMFCFIWPPRTVWAESAHCDPHRTSDRKPEPHSPNKLAITRQDCRTGCRIWLRQVQRHDTFRTKPAPKTLRTGCRTGHPGRSPPCTADRQRRYSLAALARCAPSPGHPGAGNRCHDRFCVRGPAHGNFHVRHHDHPDYRDGRLASFPRIPFHLLPVRRLVGEPTFTYAADADRFRRRAGWRQRQQIPPSTSSRIRPASGPEKRP